MNSLASVLSGLVSKLTALPVDPGDALARAAGLPPVLGRLLAARGVTSAAEAERFLYPDESELHDPLRMRGVEEASEMLLSAARAGRRVVVFGDYDVDGVTAVAELKAALSRVGGSPVSFLPHRLKDGYGLRPETVARVVRELSPSVIVTVDCGITAVEGVAFAREQGIDVIVTDHHLVPDELPAGAVVVNPRQPGCSYPYKELSGAGIAFKLSEAIARRAGISLSRDALLRAACLGTIADIVPLTGENRAIAALGLAALARPRAPGLSRWRFSRSGTRPAAPRSRGSCARATPSGSRSSDGSSRKRASESRRTSIRSATRSSSRRIRRGTAASSASRRPAWRGNTTAPSFSSPWRGRRRAARGEASRAFRSTRH